MLRVGPHPPGPSMRTLARLCSILAWLALVAASGFAALASEPEAVFDVVALGTRGGIVDDNLTAYLLGEKGGTEYILLDAGTVISGLDRALAMGNLAHLKPGQGLHRRRLGILRDHVKAALISHTHLDHVDGLVMASPGDAKHPLYGLGTTLDGLRDHLFNWVLWPNFTDEGENPLGTYTLRRLADQGEMQPIDGTDLRVQAYALSHSGIVSTAFLIERVAGGESVLFLGDTGPDQDERENHHSEVDHLRRLWRAVAPRIRAGTLRGIFLECAWSDPRKQLFGHLTPSWFLRELGVLAQEVGGSERPLSGLRVVVIGIKPALLVDGPGGEPEPAAVRIRRQLNEGNDLGVILLHPESGSQFGL